MVPVHVRSNPWQSVTQWPLPLILRAASKNIPFSLNGANSRKVPKFLNFAPKIKMRRFIAKPIGLLYPAGVSYALAKFQPNRLSRRQVISENVSTGHFGKMGIFATLWPYCGPARASSEKSL